MNIFSIYVYSCPGNKHCYSTAQTDLGLRSRTSSLKINSTAQTDLGLRSRTSSLKIN